MIEQGLKSKERGVQQNPVARSIRVGAGGSWPVFDEILDTAVIKQQSDVSCGPACGEMLLADRGLKITQDVIEKASYVPIDASDLAKVLNKLDRSHRWFGGMLQVSRGGDQELIRKLNNSGSWAAVMWEQWGSMGHLVVVDGRGNDGRLKMRDPWEGTCYTMEMVDFLAVWSRIGVYSVPIKAAV